jgi:DNA-binding MarR family transcriptional regulator
MTANPDFLPLGQFNTNDSVGYLLGRSRTMLAKALDVELIKQDITHAQGSILLMLSSGRFSTAAELARELYIDSASMTRMIDRLEKRGLIQRARSENDRRVINLLLTPQGEELVSLLPGIYQSVLCRSFTGFTADELTLLKSLLRKLLMNFQPADAAVTAQEPASSFSEQPET